MKTANDYMKLANDLGRTASELKPSDTDPYGQALKLIQFHLNTAASKARQIAEAMAKTETAAGATS